MTNTPPLSDLTAFATVARHRNFSRAAQELDLSRSALSHRMRVLEERLDTRLFHRTTRSVSLTEEGAALLARLLPVMGDLDTIFDDLADRQGALSGRVKINASESVGRLLLDRVAPQFHARHPGMHLELSTQGRLVDIVAEGFDAGIRSADMVPLDMIAVPFGRAQRFVAVASTGYLQRHGTPRTPHDLQDQRCIAQRLPGGAAYDWEFERDGEAVAINVPGTLTLDHVELMVEAAEAEMGIAYVPELTARRSIAAGRLQLVLEDWCPPGPGLCLYYPGRRHVPSGLRGFISVLREMLPN